MQIFHNENCCLITDNQIFSPWLYFEYEENKSQSNLVKHGIDYVEAQKLWVDPDFPEIPTRIQDEPRFLVITKINSKH